MEVLPLLHQALHIQMAPAPKQCNLPVSKIKLLCQGAMEE